MTVLLVDCRVKLKRGEELEKITESCLGVKNIRNMKQRMVSIIVGVLGTIPKTLQLRLDELEIGAKLGKRKTRHC